MIRDAVPADAPALKALQTASWRSAYAGFAPAQVFGAPLEADMARRWDTWPAARLIRVAEVDGAIAGFAATLWGAAPYLDNLHVAPARKRSGLGARLRADLAGCLLAAGHDSLWLTVIDGNRGARAFYRYCHGREGAAQPDALLGHPIRSIPVRWDCPALHRLRGM